MPWSPNYPNNTQAFEDDTRKMLLEVNSSQKPSMVKGNKSKSVPFDMVILAKALRVIEDNELMWKVIIRV